MASPRSLALRAYRAVTTEEQRKRNRVRRRHLRLLHGWNRYPLDRFVILTQARTGSTLFQRLIDRHPAVHCDGEILHASKGRKPSPELYVAARSMAARRTRTPAYGFKLMIGQCLEQARAPRAFLLHLTGRGWRLIHLRRDNLVRQAVSLLSAVHRQRWYVEQGSPLPRRPLTLDPWALVQQLHYLEWLRRLERRALEGLDRLELVYERDLLRSERHQETADRVFRWLDLPPATVSATLARIAPDDLRTVLTNYDELAEAVRRAGFGGYLTDGANGGGTAAAAPPDVRID